ncbi:MAG: DUF1624 domain-containing protein [Selenomonadaceae bacterium]|nr:DUF1624 domain-containing protein [Selenomonadaceae bacterium]
MRHREKARHLGLDALRGLAVILMILVDAVPDGTLAYPVLVHSLEGISLADTPFPAFVFAMGAATVFSLKEGKTGRGKKIIRRVVLLWGIGVLFNLVPYVFSWLLLPDYTGVTFWHEVTANWRPMGVLQRLALVYGLGSFLALWLKESRRLMGAALLLMAISSLGFRWYAPEAPYDLEHNIATHLDMLLFGASHLYQGWGVPFDPEGVYGTFNTAATFLWGVLAGRLITSEIPPAQKSRLMLVGAGLFLGGGWLWNQWEIVSKNLWTAPYVLLNVGIDTAALLLLSHSQMKFFRRPLVVFGRRPLFFYLASNFALIFLWVLHLPTGEPAFTWLWQRTWGKFFSPEVSTTLFAASWCLLWLVLGEILCRWDVKNNNLLPGQGAASPLWRVGQSPTKKRGET